MLVRIPGDGVDPAENVHQRKQRRLGMAARAYLAGLDHEPYCRFDVVTLVRDDGEDGEDSLRLLALLPLA